MPRIPHGAGITTDALQNAREEIATRSADIPFGFAAAVSIDLQDSVDRKWVFGARVARPKNPKILVFRPRSGRKTRILKGFFGALRSTES